MSSIQHRRPFAGTATSLRTGELLCDGRSYPRALFTTGWLVVNCDDSIRERRSLFLPLLIVAGIVGAMTQPSAPRTARARVRDELTREIKEVPRRQLAARGMAELSLRAVARETGMGSSTVYRYFPSRDRLLTALIVDAYDAVGAMAEQAESAVRRADVSGRWMSVVRAVREWAVAHPQEYALIFGSPVPGYRATGRRWTPWTPPCEFRCLCCRSSAMPSSPVAFSRRMTARSRGLCAST